MLTTHFSTNSELRTMSAQQIICSNDSLFVAREWRQSLWSDLQVVPLIGDPPATFSVYLVYLVLCGGTHKLIFITFRVPHLRSPFKTFFFFYLIHFYLWGQHTFISITVNVSVFASSLVFSCISLAKWENSKMASKQRRQQSKQTRILKHNAINSQHETLRICS